MRSHWLYYTPWWFRTWFTEIRKRAKDWEAIATDNSNRRVIAEHTNGEYRATIKQLNRALQSDHVSTSTVARIAGNIASRVELVHTLTDEFIAERSVRRARVIAAEIKRTASPAE